MDLALLYQSIEYEKKTTTLNRYFQYHKISSLTFIVHRQTCITVTISRDCRSDSEGNGNVTSNFIVKREREKGKDEV